MSTFRKLTFPVLSFALLVLAGCAGLSDGLGMFTGSGNPVTTEYEFTDFDQVTVESAFEGTVTRGDAYRVVVTVDDNLLERLDVRQENDRVIIGFVQPTVVNDADLTYEITLPTLRALEASGASRAQIAGFDSGDDFDVEASGASRVEGDVSSGDVDAHASGASSITLLGQGGNLTAEASGASTIDLSGFTTGDAAVNASGASTIIVSASGRLDAEASGASNVRYLGQPALGDIHESGGASVEAQ